MSEQSAEESDVEVDFDAVDPLSLDEALSIIGEETRARIVVELGKVVREDGTTPGSLSFSELRERVGVADSGRFNYHLDKLVDTFVRKDESRYKLRAPGQFLYQAVVAGTLTDRETVEPFEVGECPDCGEGLIAESPSNHCLYVGCEPCDGFMHMLHLPAPGVDGRSREELFDAALRKNHHDTAALRDGVCRGCGATVTSELRIEAGEVWEELYDYDVWAVFACSECQGGGVGHPAMAALTAPAVLGFFADHDRDARTMAPWHDPVADAMAATTVADDRSRVTVPFELGDERLRVVLDDDFRVVESERLLA